MDPPASNSENDDVFVDARDDCPSPTITGEALPEPSGSTSTLCDPQPSNSHPHPPSATASPATTIRRRSISRGFPAKESTDLGSGSSIGSDSDLINGARTNFRHQPRYRNLRILKEDENLAEKSDSNEAQVSDFPSTNDVREENNEAQVSAFPSTNDVREENNEESTITTAANDNTPGDFADSAAELGDSSSNLLEFIAGLVIKAIGFQIKLFIMFVTYPMLFMFHSCMFFVDPFRTMRRGKDFFTGILARVWGDVFGCISPSVQRWVKDHKSFWDVALRCGCGFLWATYVCCILFGLLVSSLVFSGFLMKYSVEKPIQMKETLNFDYTKHSPVAYVPIVSCAGVDGGHDSESNIAVSKWMGERVIPSKHKVQVTVSLLVPESGYNRNLGVFQVRVDFLLSNGKTIASSSQPCMLRFRSEPIRLIMTFLRIAPLVTGYISETQILNVKMRGFIEGDVPTSCLKVTLEQRAEYRPGAGIPEIYDASLVIESELPFFKRIIWHWKMSIFIWVTMMTFMMELLFVLVCCRPIIIPRTRQRSGSALSPGTQNNLQAQS